MKLWTSLVPDSRAWVLGGGGYHIYIYIELVQNLNEMFFKVSYIYSWANRAKHIDPYPEGPNVLMMLSSGL